MAQRIIGRPWTEYEDQLLTQAISIHGESDNWKLVALSIPGRTNKACRKRWLHSLCPSVKKSAWTREEDTLLLSLYAIHSTKWSVIARHIQGRTDDACSKRYREALDPSLKKGDWTPEEDTHLLQAHERLGGKWGQIGTELSRSGLGCRNRWRLLDRKRAALAQKPFSNGCGPQLSSVSWPDIPMLTQNELWDQANLTDHTSTPLCCPEPYEVEDLMRPPTPPRFQFSSSSLSSALSSPDFPRDSSPARCLLDFRPDSEPGYCGINQCLSPQPHLNEVDSAPNNPITITDKAGPHVSNDSPGDCIDPSHNHVPGVTVCDDPEPVSLASISTPILTHSAVEHPGILSPTVPQIPSEFGAHHPVSVTVKVLDRSEPRKRSRNASKPKLSSRLPVDSDKTLFPYVCGHEGCWPVDVQQGSVRFNTSKELWDHSKHDHSEAMGGSKPFRCGLDGCGKGWKSINGLQYHLQVSKTHFRQALLTQHDPRSRSNHALVLVSTLSGDSGGIKQRKKYKCPHHDCPNEYRQKSGLRYHLSHGHPSVAPVQLPDVPPALVEKMNKQIDRT